MATLREKLIEESLIVSLVCVVFLFHFRSALVAILTLPLAVLMALLAMRGIGLTSNIMSLGGIAIAIGAMVDAAIIMIENAHKHLEHEKTKPEAERRRRTEVIIAAAKEVGPSLFFSLLSSPSASCRSSPCRTRRAGCSSRWPTPRRSRCSSPPCCRSRSRPFLMTLLIRGRIPTEEKNPINRC